MEFVYGALFEECDEGGYSVSFPDLPGCFTEGDTLGEAIAMAKEAACGWIYGEIERGNAIPEATPREKLKDSDEGFINMLLLDMDEYRRKRGDRAIKKTLTLPEWLNSRAVEAGINFSQVLQEALKEKLGVA